MVDPKQAYSEHLQNI